ncbi:hypothetical protein V8C43DRAFT_251658 [Trichoderma afarasin]
MGQFHGSSYDTRPILLFSFSPAFSQISASFQTLSLVCKGQKKLVVAAQLCPVPESNLTSAKTEEFLATHGISWQAHVLLRRIFASGSPLNTQRAKARCSIRRIVILPIIFCGKRHAGAGLFFFFLGASVFQ